jgi:hypothetical protein
MQLFRSASPSAYARSGKLSPTGRLLKQALKQFALVRSGYMRNPAAPGLLYTREPTGALPHMHFHSMRSSLGILGFAADTSGSICKDIHVHYTPPP